MFSSVFNERFRSNPLCDFRLGTVATSDHETPLTTSAVLDKVVDMSVVVQRQVPMVQMVQKTVGHEGSQSACMHATGGVAAYQLTSTAWN